MLKKILSFGFITFFIFSTMNINSFADHKNKNWKVKYFRVTAYYSPLPNQSHYIKWTYRKELIMNWMWIRWASGKKVFEWMLAAPKNYSFWTKIKLEWLWTWEVADRWGAIVKAWVRAFKHDRIDIWVWTGEKWLQRAMFWWNRVIKWEIVNNNSKINLDISNIPAPRWTIYHATKNPDLIKRTENTNEKIYLSSAKKTNWDEINKNNIFSWPIKNSSWVKILQKKLTEMKLYSWDINWEYSSIRNIILDFQLKNKVISKKTDIWAGNFWPKTRKTLKQKYNQFLENKKLEEKKAKIEAEKKILLKKERKIKTKEYTKKINSLWIIKLWDISHEVRELQIILKKLWFFEYKDTAIFWNITKQSLINYQISKKLIKNKNSKWAWIFWPNTKKSLIKDLTEKDLVK